MDQYDHEPGRQEHADAVAEVEARGRLLEAARRYPRIANALLVYGFASGQPAPGDVTDMTDVTLHDLARIAGASVDDLRRWLQMDEE